MQVRLGRPNVAHLEQSARKIAPELSNHNADGSLPGLVGSDQVQRLPTVNASYSVVDVIIPSEVRMQ